MFPQLSENAANSIYWLGWTLFLLSALFGLVGTILTLWGDKERERYSDIRLSDNEKETKRAVEGAANANKAAAEANERAAGLEKDAAIARLELEQIKEKQQPRSISPEQRKVFIEYLSLAKKRPVRVDVYSSNQETIGYGQQIRECLDAAGFANSQFPKIERITGPALTCPNGARVAVGYYNMDELQADNNTPYTLLNAFKAINVLACPSVGNLMGEKPGEVRVIIADK